MIHLKVGSFLGFGERMKQLRLLKKLTQEELAKKLNLSKSNISKYEANTVEPNLHTLRAIAELFDVSIDYLVGKTDEQSNKKEHPSSLAEINRIVNSFDGKKMEFFNTEEWKYLGPEEVTQIEQHFKFMVHQAKLKKGANKKK